MIFRKCVEEVAFEGGDADSNCAPLGALVTAFLTAQRGKMEFPASWINAMTDQHIFKQFVDLPT